MALTRIIADSSSVILLQKSLLLRVLLQHYQVIITRHVYDELTGDAKKGTAELQSLLRNDIISCSGEEIIDGLDRGESSVITLFLAGVGDFVLLDDKKGAKYCKSQKIPFINSLLVSRILCLAGAISEDASREAFRQLIHEGYYSKKIIKKASAMRDVELRQFMPLGFGERVVD